MPAPDYMTLPRPEFIKRYAEAVWDESPEIRKELKEKADLFRSFCEAAWQADPAAIELGVGPVTRSRVERDAVWALLRATKANTSAAKIAELTRVVHGPADLSMRSA